MNQFDKQLLLGFSLDTIIAQNREINADKLNEWLKDKNHIEYIRYVSYSIGNNPPSNISNIYLDYNLQFRYMIMAILKNDHKMLSNYYPTNYIRYTHYLESHECYNEIMEIIKKYEEMTDMESFSLDDFRLFEEYLFDEILYNQMPEDYCILYAIIFWAIICCFLYYFG